MKITLKDGKYAEFPDNVIALFKKQLGEKGMKEFFAEVATWDSERFNKERSSVFKEAGEIIMSTAAENKLKGDSTLCTA